MVAWGTLACQVEGARSSWRSDVTAWGLNLVGTGLALYVFMADTIRVANQGVEALRNVLPARFNWPLFAIALLLMAAPVFQAYQQISIGTQSQSSEL
jgi:hypothetical protein